MINIGINGLGRIGRVLLRQILDDKNLNLVCVNDINPDISNLAYLIKYDSTYGKLENNKKICVIYQYDPFFYVDVSEVDKVRLNDVLKELKVDIYGKEASVIKYEEVEDDGSAVTVQKE